MHGESSVIVPEEEEALDWDERGTSLSYARFFHHHAASIGTSSYGQAGHEQAPGDDGWDEGMADEPWSCGSDEEEHVIDCLGRVSTSAGPPPLPAAGTRHHHNHKSPSSQEEEERQQQPCILQRPDMLWCQDVWDDGREAEALAAVAKQGGAIEKRLADKYEARAGQNWNLFYQHNSTNFYKDRHYLQAVFPDVLAPAPPITSSSKAEDGGRCCVLGLGCCDRGKGEEEERGPCPAPGHKVLIEVGCGVGNAAFPLLECSPGLFVWALDFAKKAIMLARQHPTYTSAGNGRCRALVCDVVKEDLPPTIHAHGGADLCLCMFSLSAMAPATMPALAHKLYRVLKPGGRVLVRDYGRYDEAQLRFKRGHRLGENFYLRSDGTRAYYFTTEDLQQLFTGAGLEVVELHYIRRQQANRAQRTARRRVWVHAVFEKKREAKEEEGDKYHHDSSKTPPSQEAERGEGEASPPPP